ARELGDQFLNGCSLVQFHFGGAAAADPVRLCSALQRKQLLLDIGVEQIQIWVLLVKFAEGLFIREVMHHLFVSIADLHQIGREFTASDVALGQEALKLASMSSDRFA